MAEWWTKRSGVPSSGAMKPWDVLCPAAWQQCWLQSRHPSANPRPSAFQAGHIPSWRGSGERYALPTVAAGCRWSLLLLSPLLSTRRKPSVATGPAACRGWPASGPGRLPPGPLVSDRRGCRGSDAQGVGPEDAFAKRFERIFGCLLTVEGHPRTLSGPSQDPGFTTALHEPTFEVLLRRVRRCSVKTHSLYTASRQSAHRRPQSNTRLVTRAANEMGCPSADATS